MHASSRASYFFLLRNETQPNTMRASSSTTYFCASANKALRALPPSPLIFVLLLTKHNQILRALPPPSLSFVLPYANKALHALPPAPLIFVLLLTRHYVRFLPPYLCTCGTILMEFNSIRCRVHHSNSLFTLHWPPKYFLVNSRLDDHNSAWWIWGVWLLDEYAHEPYQVWKPDTLNVNDRFQTASSHHPSTCEHLISSSFLPRILPISTHLQHFLGWQG